MYIPNYVKRVVGLPTEELLDRESSNCVCYTEPSVMELQNNRRLFVNRGRALLKMLGFDPTPHNVKKITADNLDSKILEVNGRFFKVLDNDELLSELELILLSNPERLPSNFLALFFTKAFPYDLDFKVIRIVAESLKRANTIDAKWAMHRLIDFDTEVKNHIQEVIDHVGVETLFYKNPVNQVQFMDANYTIIEFQPQNTISDNFDISRVINSPIE